VSVVKAWKDDGCTKDEARLRLVRFLDDVRAHGDQDQDDPVRDVLDFVVGFCRPDAKLFP
jgi:hypothetical protein